MRLKIFLSSEDREACSFWRRSLVRSATTPEPRSKTSSESRRRMRMLLAQTPSPMAREEEFISSMNEGQRCGQSCLSTPTRRTSSLVKNTSSRLASAGSEESLMIFPEMKFRTLSCSGRPSVSQRSMIASSSTPAATTRARSDRQRSRMPSTRRQASGCCRNASRTSRAVVPAGDPGDSIASHMASKAAVSRGLLESMIAAIAVDAAGLRAGLAAAP
mmetsp:Transcript_10429/g.40568  ORF Transcript_10429/g.40568 Transcript_10429/m.40568 type:complete len:217 (+) Transcript_10429:1378-2028(+)